MPKSDDKGEPVKTVTIGGKKVEVPIIFVLPEEAGEKEIERYQHPKVHIESKKVAPLLAGGAGIAGGVASAGKKIGEGIKDTVEQAPQALGEGAKLSETLSAESEEKPLDKLTHGKLEEVEKLPFAVPKEESEAMISGKVRPSWEDSTRHERDFQPRNEDSPLADLDKMFNYSDEEIVEEDGKTTTRKKKKPKLKGYSDEFKEGGFAQESFEEAPKKKKKKKKQPLLSNSREAMNDEWFPERKSIVQKKEDWDKEEKEWEQIGNTNKFRKRRKKKLQDVDFDESDAFGIDKLKSLQLEIKDALKPEKNQGEMSTEEFGGRSGRNPKTGRELNDYLESQQPYGFGKLGKKEPQTSRGQADDATQERAMNYYSAKDPRSGRDSALKKPAREAGENTVRGDARIDQHEPKSHETASSGNDWKSSNRVGREMYDQEPISEIKEEDYDKEGKLSHHKIREVPRGGKAPRDSPEPLGRKAQFTGNEKLMRQMAGYPPSYFEDTYDKEEERRRDTKLPKTGKRPKGTTGRKKSWEKWLENKSLGALGWGKLDRKTGKKKKLRRRQPTLDDFPEDNGDKKDET